MKMTPGKLKAIALLHNAGETGLLLPHTWDHSEWWTKNAPASIQSFNALKAGGLAEITHNCFWVLTDSGKNEFARQVDKVLRVPEPTIVPNTTQVAPTPPPEPTGEWNPPVTPPGEPTYRVLLTEKEIEYIKHSLVHSANVYKLFCEQGSKEYPLKETNEYIAEALRIGKILDAA